ncbi:hypothetical protein A7U60_g833 [Sanghuangporus baumii]|uniref:Elongator complex protein 5 n=1 Tax=Sanghuangporus baumii TaxID=108892 RepID=A0A9Q5I502_SANBA|nr:hypothetical protein A7U60_g833 [Sanghuangporus baumii]
MAENDALIRPYVHGDEDNRLVRFTVAKAAMEPLAAANRKDPHFGSWGYLRPLPGFAVMSLPIMRQRPEFEKQSIETLKRPDIANITEYYSRSPSSGFWIYDFGNQFVGLIAVDASTDSLSDDTVSSSQEAARETARSITSGKDKIHKPNTPPTAVIRHFYVAELYRTAVAQNDLITFAVKRIFESSSVVERIRMTPSPLMDYIEHSLKSAGFEVIEQGPKVELKVIDWTNDVPGYGDSPVDWKLRIDEIQSAIKGSSRDATVVIDSVDTIEEDLESPSEASSRLVCHITALSPVLPFLKQPRFAPSFIHLIAHPPALLTHLSRAYLTSPPSSSSSSSDSPDALKFWRVFVPLSDRPLEIEALVFGSDEHAEGGGSPDELVVEILVRGRGADVPIISSVPVSGSGKRKGIERVLEGWSVSKGGPVPLEELDSLKNVWKKKILSQPEAPDPTKDLTFNLSLTDSQQASRSQVPLPYEHNGRSTSSQNQSAHIFYDPDSADDLDDEDPDEDLDL